LRVGDLGERDHLGENLHLLVAGGTAGEKDVDDLLEIEQPERQPQIAGICHIGAIAEGSGHIRYARRAGARAGPAAPAAIAAG